MIADNIADEDIVCMGEKGDILGRYDNKIIGVETRKVGFDKNNTYKAIITSPYNSNGAMKVWR